MTGTKHALEAFSDALRLELLPSDISVSLIKPAYVKTEIGDKAVATIDAVMLTDVIYGEFLSKETARLNKVFEGAPGVSLSLFLRIFAHEM
jgi:short-subunit dehydrogenase